MWSRLNAGGELISNSGVMLNAGGELISNSGVMLNAGGELVSNRRPKKTSQLREAVYPAMYIASSIVLPCLR